MSDFSRNMLKAAVCVLGLLIVADSVTKYLFWESNVALDIVDIQSSNILQIKLDAIRRFEGRKIVFLGDSLMYGRSMEQHGDLKWRQSTLCAVIRKFIDNEDSEDPILTINLAMNGALPTDLEKLSYVLEPLDPDLIVMDLSLRSFSEDFGQAETMSSRGW